MLLALSLCLCTSATDPARCPAIPAPARGDAGTDEVLQGAPAVAWFTGSFGEALAEAERRQSLVLIEFSADWCSWCARHAAENLVLPRVVSRMNDFVCLRADLSVDGEGTFLDPQAERLMRDFSVRRFPTLIFVRPDGQGGGRGEDLISGFLPARNLLQEIDRIARGEGTRSSLERRVLEDQGELEWRYQLALKLDALGDSAGYQEEIDWIVAADPKGLSLPRRRMALGILREKLWGCMRDPDVEPDPAELAAFLDDEEHPELLSGGWLLMGTVLHELGRHRESLRAYRRAWKRVPTDSLAGVGNGIAWGFWLQREHLSPSDRRFALEVARAALRAYEEQAPVQEPDVLATFLDTLACCHFLRGERAEALALLERCVALCPGVRLYVQRLADFRAE